MSNYIKNRLTFNDRTEEILVFLSSEDKIVDFNKIVPMPEGLDICDSSLGDLGMEWLVAKNLNPFSEEGRRAEELGKLLASYAEEPRTEALEMGMKYLENIIRTGHKTWYTWRRENWGTKWNARKAVQTSPNQLEFETAWDGVVGLMEKLSAHFPDVIFQYEFADEDTGSNTGTGVIFNGKATMIYPENQSRMGYELAFRLRPDRQENFVLKGENYEWKEEEGEEAS